jgi:hypothetical protein
VEAVAQALANRTQFLKAGLDALSDVARRGADNEFSGRNTFDQNINFAVLSATDPLIGTGVQANDDPDHGSNRWKHILDVKCSGGGHHLHMYSGTDATITGPATYGAFVIVYNAYWDIAAQLWHKHDTSKAASAVIWHLDRVRFGAQPFDGAVTWADWANGPITALNLWVSDFLLARALTVTDDIVLADGDLYLDGAHSMLLTGSDTVRRRYACVPLCDAACTPAANLEYIGGGLLANSAAGVASVAIRIPNGARLDGVAIVHKQFTGAAHTVFNLYRAGRSGFLQLGAAGQTDARETTGADTIETVLDATGYVFNAADDTLHLDLGMAGTNVVLSVQANFVGTRLY